MFYLNHFFKSVMKSGSKGHSFVLLTFALMILYPQRAFLESQLTFSLKDQMPSPYFYALLSVPDEVNSIRTKMATLPGVKEVRLIEKEDLIKDVKSLMGDTLKDTPPDLVDFNYVGLKVVYDLATSEGARKIIREYLSKLAGDDKVTLGPIKVDETPETKETGWYFYLKKLGLFPILLVLIIFWVLSLLSFGRGIRESAYLIEQFQRRKSVPMKLLFSGEALIILLSLPLSMLWGSFAPISYILIAMLIVGVSFLIVRSPTWGDR